MWVKIDTELVFSGMIVGNIITNNPTDPQDQYQIKSVHSGFVKALHSNGRSLLKIFPVEELLAGKWWVADAQKNR